MRGYETCLIINPETSEEALEGLLNKLNDTITNLNGKVLKTDKWDKKKLQYPIKKQQKAHFYFLSYLGNNQILDEISHFLRFNENVLRFKTLKLDETAEMHKQETDTGLETPTENKHRQETDSELEQY